MQIGRIITLILIVFTTSCIRPDFLAAQDTDVESQGLIVDFRRSFLNFKTNPSLLIQNNHSRRQIESKLSVIDSEQDVTTDYFLGVSVRSEAMYQTDRIFLSPNYEFFPIFSTNTVQFRRRHFPYRADNNEEEKGALQNLSSFSADVIYLARNKSLTPTQILKASIEGYALQAKVTTKLNNQEFIFQFPIKLINVDDVDGRFQVDTGPIVVPQDFKVKILSNSQLVRASIAFNSLDKIELILEEPFYPHCYIRILCSLHYARRVRLDASVKVFKTN